MNALSDEQIDAEWTKAGGPAMTDIATEGHEADATQTIRDFARAVITANFHEHQNSAAIDPLMQLVREAINDSCHMSEYHIETVSLPKIRAEIEALTAIEPWRAKLAEQCGKTLAAQAQRDELRGLLEEACAKIPLPPELVQVSDGEPYDSPGNTPVIVDTGKPPKKGEFAGERCINMAMAAAASVPSWFRYQRMKWDDNPAYAEAKAFIERIRAALSRCAPQDIVDWPQRAEALGQALWRVRDRMVSGGQVDDHWLAELDGILEKNAPRDAGHKPERA